MAKFRKKPVVIEAEQYLGPSVVDRREVRPVLVPGMRWVPSVGENMVAAAIPTLEGLMLVSHGDWIITGVKGEKYPCKPDIFVATYERVDADAMLAARKGGG